VSINGMGEADQVKWVKHTKDPGSYSVKCAGEPTTQYLISMIHNRLQNIKIVIVYQTTYRISPNIRRPPFL
jgi:hypothetical protein